MVKQYNYVINPLMCILSGSEAASREEKSFAMYIKSKISQCPLTVWFCTNLKVDTFVG